MSFAMLDGDLHSAVRELFLQHPAEHEVAIATCEGL